ncbi:hypothetical protein [Streptomyces sp. NPDC048737]|uniref:hypothetical protein n=1 Tax=unclassified Streptomyces TaxID=2593676 RepID=UPI0034168117
MSRSTSGRASGTGVSEPRHMPGTGRPAPGSGKAAVFAAARCRAQGLVPRTRMTWTIRCLPTSRTPA